ncbi:MAG: hypothetical protein EA350_02415, partial [Gemmatimonadales bacterium]
VTLTILGLLLLVGSLGACTGKGFAPPDRGPGLLSPGAHELVLLHDGMERRYLVDVPDAARSGFPPPVVLAFHGGGGNPWQFRRTNGLLELGALEGFILVHPAGFSVAGQGSWNAGFCCGRAAALGVDDVGFVEALLDDLSARIALDPDRVYATGHSNGGMITYRLAEEIPHRLAAVAPVGGARLSEAGPAGPPVPLLHIHSRDDPRALHAGGLGPPFPGTSHRVRHPPVEAVLEWWKARNGCEGPGRLLETRIGDPGSPGEGHRAELLAWDACTPLAHWRLEGPGHGWPGAPLAGLREAVIGPGTTVVDAAHEAWEFLRQHRRLRLGHLLPPLLESHGARRPGRRDAQTTLSG